jgi:hypothetical protein
MALFCRANLSVISQLMIAAGLMLIMLPRTSAFMPGASFSRGALPVMRSRSSQSFAKVNQNFMELSSSRRRVASRVSMSTNEAAADMLNTRSSPKPVSGLSPAGEWHSVRRRNILSKYPELRQLETEDWRGGAVLLASNALQMSVSPSCDVFLSTCVRLYTILCASNTYIRTYIRT